MQLGKYQLVRKLATGGMAEVYLAKAAGPMGFEKTLVLKRILPHLAEDPAFVEMFLGEAKLAAQLEHPNVVQIFDFGEAEGSYFLAMEFIDGVNLRKLVKRAADAPLPPALCAKVVASAAEGLAYAHEFCDPATGVPLGLIHRDVSPDNILVSRQGAVKVVDFGIAKVAGQSHRTQTGIVKGKVAYMPPEQLQTRPLDRRVDVYALGIVLYELLTGKRPFEATTDVSVMQAILFETFIPAVERRADVPVALQHVLEKALAKDRERRYPDCRALQQDLERYVMSTGEPVGAYQVAQLVVKMMTEGAGATVGVTPPAAVVHGPAPVATSPLPASRPSMVAPLEPPVDSTSPTTPMPLSVQQMMRPPPPPVEAVSGPAPRATVQERAVKTPARGRTGSRAPGEGLAVAAASPAKELRALPPPVVAGDSPTVPVTGSLRADSDDVVHTQSAELEVPKLTKRSRWAVPAVVGGVLLAAGIGFVLLRTEEPVVLEYPPPVEQKAEGKGSVGKVAEAPPASSGSQPASESRPVVGGEAEKAAQAPGETPPAVAPVAPAVAEKGSAEPSRPEVVTAPAGKDPVSEPVAKVVKEKVAAVSEPASQKKAARPPRTVAAAPVTKGTLEFRIRPYAVVSLNGKVLGQTPLAPVEVPVGVHTLRLVNKELGKDVVKTFEVKAGEPNLFKLNLEAE